MAARRSDRIHPPPSERGGPGRHLTRHRQPRPDARTWKTDGSNTSATAIRADDDFSDCAWFPANHRPMRRRAARSLQIYAPAGGRLTTVSATAARHSATQPGTATLMIAPGFRSWIPAWQIQ